MSFSSVWGYGRATMLAAALAALPVLAQVSPDQSSGSDQFGQSGYNQGNETTLEGTVVVVNTNTPTGEHVILDTNQGRYDVQLGPQWYLQQQQTSIQPGERIQVTGSQTTISGQQALIARQVMANGNTITLRTNSGIPLWSGSQQASQQGQYQQGPYGQQGMYGQSGPYQQGQYQQPPFQQTPYTGQPGPFSQGQQQQVSRGADIYNPFTETTLTGTVEQVNRCSCGPFSSTYATLNTNQGRITVQLAPSQYLSQNQLQIKRGDQIQVIGSRLTVNGNDVLLARLVSNGQRTVALRTPQGTPQWTRTQTTGQFGQQQPPADGMPPSTDNPEF